MVLTDIAIEHTYKGKNGNQPLDFVMHPFEVSSGPNAGRFEVFSDLGKPQNGGNRRSGHVTRDELAELFAHGLMDRLQVCVRMRPADGLYPSAPPVKRPTRSHVVVGSDFERRVASIDPGAPLSAGLRRQLEVMGVATLMAGA